MLLLDLGRVQTYDSWLFVSLSFFVTRWHVDAGQRERRYPGGTFPKGLSNGTSSRRRRVDALETSVFRENRATSKRGCSLTGREPHKIQSISHGFFSVGLIWQRTHQIKIISRSCNAMIHFPHFSAFPLFQICSFSFPEQTNDPSYCWWFRNPTNRLIW